MPLHGYWHGYWDPYWDRYWDRYCDRNAKATRHEIETFEHDGARYVAMKRVCENIGLNWDGQRKTLVEQSNKFNYGDIPVVAADGNWRQMGCMPVEELQRYGRCATVAHLKSGNSSDHYYLNEGQTCVICAKSEASKAPEDPGVRSERKFT